MPFQNTFLVPIDDVNNLPLYGRVENPVGEDLIISKVYVDRRVAGAAGVIEIYASQDGVSPTGPVIASFPASTGLPYFESNTQPGCGFWPADHYLIATHTGSTPDNIEAELYIECIYA